LETIVPKQTYTVQLEAMDSSGTIYHHAAWIHA
jgi:hypothetical protein